MGFKITSGIILVLITLVLYSTIIFFTSPIKESLDYCQDKKWDGGEYNTGITDYQLFQENYPIVVKCNKAEDTDAIIQILNVLYFWDQIENNASQEKIE